MDNDKVHVINWLKEIMADPENWHQWYSDSEVKLLAECALELLTLEGKHERISEATA